jgi:hypothetical protein
MHLVLTVMLLAGAADSTENLPARQLVEPQTHVIATTDASLGLRKDRDTVVKWKQDTLEYHEWYEKWGEKCEPGWFVGCDLSKRRLEPRPPDFLAQECATVLEDPAGFYTEPCAMLRDYLDDLPTKVIRHARMMARIEKIEKTTFWTYLHFDFAMVPSQSQGWGKQKIFSPGGMHVGIPIKKFELFAAPGVMILRMPDPRRPGYTNWMPAYNLGGGWRMTDRLPLPVTDKRAKLYLNIMEVFVPAGPGNVAKGRIDMVGLSVTFDGRAR